jgi:hypothetical protein
MVKDEEKLLFIYTHFIFTSVLHVIYKSRVEDHNQQVLQIEQWISLKEVYLTQPLLL